MVSTLRFSIGLLLLVWLSASLVCPATAPAAPVLIPQAATAPDVDSPESKIPGVNDADDSDDPTIDLPLDRAQDADDEASPEPPAPPANAKPQMDSATTTDPVADPAVAAEVAPAATAPAPASIDFLLDGESPSSIEQLRAMEEHFASLAKQVAPATVNIQIGMAQGSGVVVTDDGYILTAAHVIGRPSTIATVTFPDGTKVDAQTLGLSRGLDFGMLKILEKEGDDFPHLEVGLSAELKRGQWVMAVGHPGGIDEKRGLVFRAGRIISNQPGKLQTDCTLVGGDSGGPLVDMDGAVVGIHSRIGSRLSDNLHAPIDVYSENWDRMDLGLVLDGVPYLGFTVKPNSNRVTVVSEGGPAKQAGIKPQDRIIEIEGQKVEDYSQLELAIVKLRPYQKATFKIKRRSKTLTFEVIVSETK